MTRLSKDFLRKEFECKCGCGFDTVDAELLSVLQEMRDHFSRRVIITSACRCESHNRLVGGSSASYHLLARAADVVVETVDAHRVYAYLDELSKDRFGIGLYKDFVHFDTRSSRARWDHRVREGHARY